MPLMQMSDLAFELWIRDKLECKISIQARNHAFFALWLSCTSHSSSHMCVLETVEDDAEKVTFYPIFVFGILA